MAKSPQIQGAVGVDKIPDHLKERGSLQRVDYADAFSTPIPQVLLDASAEEWARAMLGDVYNFSEYLAWHVCMRLPLTKESSPEWIAGWRVGARGDEWIRIDNAGWLAGSNLIITKEEGRVAFVTLIEYKSRLMKPWWWVISFVHRNGVPNLLKMGINKLSKRR